MNRKVMEGSGVIPLDLHEYTKALFLARSVQDDEDLQMESLRLIMYGYKMELESISKRPLHSILPASNAPKLFSSPNHLLS